MKQATDRVIEPHHTMAIHSVQTPERSTVTLPREAGESRRRAKIVHVITGLLTGGTEMKLYKLLQRINPSRFEHAVVSLAEGDWPMVARIRELGVPVYCVGLRAERPTPAALLRLANLVRGLHPDLLQGWMYHGNLAALMAAALLPARVPVVWSICSTQCDLRREKFTTALAIRLGARLSRWSSAILTDSQASAHVHQQRLNYDGRWQVIPNGFDLDRFQPSGQARTEVRAELSLAPDALLVGLIARYQAVKDHAGFLQAAALIRRQTQEAHFLLTGRGVGGNTALREQASALGLSGAVHLLGERADMPRVSAALDIEVSSSYSESFPNVVGEAMSCGVPCVVTDVGDSAYLVGDTGLVVPPRNPAALAEACNELIRRGSEGRRTLGLAARERIASQFSIGAIVARYEDFYCQSLKQKHVEKGCRPCAA